MAKVELSNEKDLSAYYFIVQGKRNSLNVFNQAVAIEQAMFDIIFPPENQKRKDIFLREINEAINENGVGCNLVVIKDILNYWSQVHLIKKERIDKVNNQYRIQLSVTYKGFKTQLEQRLKVGRFCLTVLETEFLPKAKEEPNVKDKRLFEFSVLDIKIQTENLINETYPIRFYEFILLYFPRLKVIELKDGLMIFYNPMKITREIEDNRKRYTQEDYQQLTQYYESKTEQFLMLTFSRPVALEFKSRLYQLVGIDAFHIDIFTYHGFAFQLAESLGDIEKSQIILPKVKAAIAQEEIPLDRIKNKRVVVVDEYQDVSQEEYDFLMAIVDCSEKIRVIAAGDDDQNKQFLFYLNL